MKRTLLPLTGASLLLASLTTIATAQQVGEAYKVTTENRGTFLAIPSKPMSIWDKHRRQIWGTIVGRDAEGIRVLKSADRKEYHIKWDVLDPNRVPLYKGDVTFEEYDAAMKAKAAANTAAHQQKLAVEAARPKPLSFEETNALHKRSTQKWVEMAPTYRAMSALEIQKLLRDKNLDFMLAIEGMRINHERSYGTNWRYAWDLVGELEIKDPTPEKVSLRPEFERLGVRSQQQVYNSCIMYSTHNLIQFLAKKHKLRTPSIQELLAGRILDPKAECTGPNTRTCLETFERINGVRVNVQSLGIFHRELNHELLKNQLRLGRPCLVGVPGAHQMLAVGFEVDAHGNTTLELLDTNRVYQDGGYRKYPLNSVNVGGDISAWIE